MSGSRKPVVGIFSREAEETYEWVIMLLRSPTFRRSVGDIRPVPISNAVCGGTGRFQEEITKCQFSILYHSQKRGRLNITDVTDSLYDQELRDLSGILGRDKVLVLVDDVEDDADAVQRRISSEQPLIGELAALLVVFSKNEKPIYCNSAGEYVMGSGSYQTRLDSRTRDKMERIRTQIGRRGEIISKRGFLLIIFGVLIIIVVVILCSLLIHH